MGSFQVLHTRADPLSPKEERVIQSWWSKSSNDYSPLAGLLLKSDLWPYVGLIIAPPAIPYLSILSTPEKMSINSVLRAAVGIHQDFKTTILDSSPNWRHFSWRRNLGNSRIQRYFSCFSTSALSTNILDSSPYWRHFSWRGNLGNSRIQRYLSCFSTCAVSLTHTFAMFIINSTRVQAYLLFDLPVDEDGGMELLETLGKRE